MSRLREMRKKRGYSQFKLAIMSNVSPSDISKIERGVIIAYPRWKERLADALDVHVADIFPEPLGVNNNEL